VQFYRRIRKLLEAIADVPPPPSSAIVQNVADTRITFDDVLALIKKHEGHKNHVYLDSVGKKTIGIGFNLTRPDAPAILKSIGVDYNKVLSGQQDITDEQAKTLFQINIKTAYNDAKKFLPQFDGLPRNVKLAVLDMSFNLGYTRLNKFTNTKQHIDAGNYKKAGEEILNSKWATQVRSRANDLAKLFFSS
jgi:lysozyme